MADDRLERDTAPDRDVIDVSAEPGADSDAEQAAGVLRRLELRVAGLRAGVVSRRGGHHAWRIGVGVLGGLVVAAGIVMLIIPGPGWLVIFLGLGIWSTEFSWARRLLEYGQRQVRKWTHWIAGQPRWLVLTAGALVVVIVGVAVGLWLTI